MKYLAVFATLLTGSTAAIAGQTYDSAGVATGTQRTQAHVISEGHIVLHTVSDYEAIDYVNPSHPVSGTTGECFGAVEIRGANASGGGSCVFTDGDGDKVTNTWTVMGFGADGALVGTWVDTGGSGKFAGISGGGSFSSKTDNATGKFANTITGAIYLP